MMRFLCVHPTHPQPRLVRQVAEVVRAGGVAVYPTDSTYALGCRIGDKEALDRIGRIRGHAPGHQFTLMCRDLSELATYARVSNAAFRMLRAHTPGPFTFVLDATKEVPRRLLHPKRKTIGLRLPEHPIPQALLAELGEPMLTTSLILPGDELALTDPEEIRDRVGRHVDVVVDGGEGRGVPTTLVDLTGAAPQVLRQGAGHL